MELNVATFQQRQQTLTEALSTRILVLDGAMGTMVQARNLHAADFGGAALEGCNEYLVKSRPEVIDDIHRAYLRAGSDIWRGILKEGGSHPFVGKRPPRISGSPLPA